MKRWKFAGDDVILRSQIRTAKIIFVGHQCETVKLAKSRELL